MTHLKDCSVLLRLTEVRYSTMLLKDGIRSYPGGKIRGGQSPHHPYNPRCYQGKLIGQARSTGSLGFKPTILGVTSDSSTWIPANPGRVRRWIRVGTRASWRIHRRIRRMHARFGRLRGGSSWTCENPGHQRWQAAPVKIAPPTFQRNWQLELC